MLYRRAVFVFALCSAIFGALQGPAQRAAAGTTGGLSGRVVASDGAPVAKARVTVTSPSQIASVETDAGGRFSFVSLAPDTYTISVEKQGLDPIALSGISVAADGQQTLALTMRPALREIGRVTARASGGLVRPGTTADVYSIDASQQDRVSALGGGGDLNTAYSAIATVPGAFVPANQSGYNQTIHVRGGDSDQVGFEFDGVPVNRGFDNYPSSSLSSLGQQELQVYTGASPANSEAQGLAGFVNQVIKTGTYPGFANVDFTLGSPSFDHSLNLEVGGATPSRTFSYYLGVGGYNQDHRYVDQFNGASLSNEFGSVLSPCPTPGGGAPPLPASCLQNGKPTGGYLLGPLEYGSFVPPSLAVRSTIVNLHFGIPHKSGGLKDDIQVLYDNDEIFTPIFSSALDEGLNNVAASNFAEGTNPGSNHLYYTDSWQYNGPLGTFLPANYQSLVSPYLFPSSPTNRPFDGPIPYDQRDVGYNQQGILKLQYQKNFSSTAFLRLYGYSYYSDYIGTGADSSYQPIVGYDSGDYELNAHTRGVSATFADQINSQNLLELQASYTTSHATRVYNEQMFNYPGSDADNFAVLVNGNDPLSGVCYGLGNGAPTATTCNDGSLALGPNAVAPTFASLAGIGCARVPYACTPSPPANVSGMKCGSGPCAYYVVENGEYGEYNYVRPAFGGYSLTDEFKPTDKLLLNLGIRLDHYTFYGDNTSGSAARTFWFNAFNQDTCFDPQNDQLQDKTNLTNAAGNQLPITAPCSQAAGAPYQPVNLQNISSQIFNYSVLQPRLGASYTVDADTVLRASYGKYNEQPSAAYEQYNALQQNLPDLLGPEFYAYGFNAPGHSVRPSISYNADFSLEHHFKHTNLSLKLTPFYRHTADQIENFYLNAKAGLISGLNIGAQTSQGFEFALDEGDFDRNGFASQLSFAYTNSYVVYSTLSNGTTVVSSINGDIQQYNAYTSYCAAHPTNARCGGLLPTDGKPAAPCYNADGSPNAGCTAGSIANPYWNAPVQSLLDPSGRFVPYSNFPAGIGSGANGFDYPYVATLVLNYKHDRFAITPSLQFVAGNRYGAPETTPGIDPATCTGALGTPVSGDPRYPYGGAGGAPFNAADCGLLSGAIPDPYTGHFDGIGEFRQPAQLLANLRLSYNASKNVEFVATLTNLYNRCFGGQKTAFTYYMTTSVCSYQQLNASESPVGNAYNPGDNVQTFLKYPYEPSFGVYNDNGDSTIAPFSAYFSMRVRL
jgi:hypothetical protein